MPLENVDGEHRVAGRLASVLLVLIDEQPEGSLGLLSRIEHPRPSPEAHPPEPASVVFEMVDEDGHVRALAGVRDAAESARALRLRVDGRVKPLAIEDEHNRHRFGRPSGSIVASRATRAVRTRSLIASASCTRIG